MTNLTPDGAGAWASPRFFSSAGCSPCPKPPPAARWLTEFVDHWPYAKAAGDVWFARDSNQKVAQRPAVPGGCDLALTGFLAVAALRPFRRRRGE